MERVTGRCAQRPDPGLDLAGDIRDRDLLATDDEHVSPDELAQRARERIRTRPDEQLELSCDPPREQQPDDRDEHGRDRVAEPDDRHARPAEAPLAGRDERAERVARDRGNDERAEDRAGKPEDRERGQEEQDEGRPVARRPLDDEHWANGWRRRRGRWARRRARGRHVGAVIGSSADSRDQSSEIMHRPRVQPRHRPSMPVRS